MKDDTISRQAALVIYDDYNVAVENGELEAYRKHRERLLELPSAQRMGDTEKTSGLPELRFLLGDVSFCLRQRQN